MSCPRLCCLLSSLSCHRGSCNVCMDRGLGDDQQQTDLGRRGTKPRTVDKELADAEALVGCAEQGTVTWGKVSIGVPRGPALGQILFCVSIEDLGTKSRSVLTKIAVGRYHQKEKMLLRMDMG